MKLAELEQKLKDLNLKGAIQLDAATKINDVQLFIESHISFLKANSGNIVYLPYYTRLMKFYTFWGKKGKS